MASHRRSDSRLVGREQSGLGALVSLGRRARQLIVALPCSDAEARVFWSSMAPSLAKTMRLFAWRALLPPYPAKAVPDKGRWLPTPGKERAP